MYADIIIDITHEKLDRIFQYSIPSHLEGMLEIGMEVVVPFGRGNHPKNGYIIGFSREPSYDRTKLKAIQKAAPGRMSIEARLISLAAWIKEEYGGTMIQALKTVLPVKKETRSRTSSLEQFFLEQKEAARQKQEYERQGGRPVLNKEQQEAADLFREEFCKGVRDTYLLYGVTGSGKTEVYLSMMETVVSQGKQVIVMIPEIALTYQTALRFCERFGDRVAILHSRMSPGERYHQMERVKQGEIQVMIGPRSALFTPFSDLGLIVMDEEHEGTYKSEQVPRYHAREVARKRGELEGASIVLGSATPSVETFFQCEEGTIRKLTLQNRAEGRLPSVRTVDMREELREGHTGIFSRLLLEGIRTRLEKKEQVMLFLNRRGYAGFVSCRSCGYVAMCRHCDVALSEHRGKKLVCHYCGYEEARTNTCPKCGSPYIGGFKAGTQKVEEMLHKEFPEARVLRMDMDSTKGKEGHRRILETFGAGEADILLGTQMIVKGHDYSGVTLVGVLAADLSLYADDYLAAERTFQLLVQAAGRAGRGEKKGEVIIQTYNPEHYSIQLAATQQYEAFYQKELYYREMMEYPPISHLAAVILSDKDKERLQTAAEYLKKFMEKADRKQEMRVIGPAVPAVEKVSDIYRKVIYLKGKDRKYMARIKDLTEAYIEINRGFSEVKVQFDFHPMNFL